MAERITVNSKKPVSTKENLISHKRKTDFRSDSSPVNRILYLQRTIGNQAVQRMVRSGALQAKLRIGQPGDKYEQEADRVADAVMRMPEPGVQRQVEPEEEMLQAKPLAGQITPLVQRQVEPEEEEEEMLQAKSREDATSEVPNDLESEINAIRGGGRPLAESERAYFEPRFGRDFSQVRMHTDTRAAESARAVNARAFTVGQDVVFGAGQYAQGASEGRRLMAHELTHVIQQQSSLNRVIINRLGKEGYDEIIKDKARRHKVKTNRVDVPSHPGWMDVEPTHYIIKSGEPFEFPHFLEVIVNSTKDAKKNVTALEGRYLGKYANIASSKLTTPVAPDSAATAKFNVTKSELWFGGNGPVKAITDPDNPVPKGKHDIEIPDFQHKNGSKYGDFGTTWFRLGHSGDRYLHPGQVSLGCATITETSEWPKIWKYLISARKDNFSVGELEVS